MLRYIKLFFLFLFAAGFLIFSIDNRQTVSISLFPLSYSADMPEFLLAIICFILGALTGGIAAGFASYQTKRQHTKSRKRVAALENEIKTIHAEPQQKP